ncbi:MAG: Tol-Pal system protein TolB [Arcobacter sp.]|nr:Tol-Pal system protein TolB [Arcobacter sp.]
MFKIFFLIFFIIESLIAVDAEIDIVRKNNIIPKVNIVLTENNIDNVLSDKIKKIIENDLAVSGHFSVAQSSIKHQNIDNKFDFISQESIKSDLILLVELKKSVNNSLIVDIVMVDVNTKTAKPKMTYTLSDLSRYPFLAHKIAIGINKESNAPSIDWMDRFVIFSKYISSKKSEIIVADYTLSYQKVVVSGGLNIFPKWANKEQSSFYYTSYDALYPTLIKQNLYGKKSENIIHSDGMLVCSDVSKDGSKLLLTMAPSGQPDIYLYDLSTNKTTRITKYSGIDVGGNFLDSESSIVFVSDRLGKPNIFSINTQNNDIERLIFHGSNNSQATTFNNYIVYSGKEVGNEFNLYLISTQNDSIKKLTNQGLNQFPKFSIDGESLLFVKNYNGNSSLGIIRLNYNTSFLFPLKSGKIQSLDW